MSKRFWCQSALSLLLLVFSPPRFGKAEGEFLEQLGIDLSHIKSPDTSDPPPPPDKVWALISHDMIRFDALTPEDDFPTDHGVQVRRFALGEFLSLERESCGAVLQWLGNDVVHTAAAADIIRLNLTSTTGMYYLMQGQQPTSNHYHWMIHWATHRMQRLVTRHVAVMVAAVMASPDCVPIKLRTEIARYFVKLRDALSGLSQLQWSGLVFGLMGDVVEGDIDDDGNIGDPDSVAIWTKDTTFALMWVSSLQRQLELYAEGTVPLFNSALAESSTLSSTRVPTEERLKRYHHSLGEFAYLEALKRQTFKSWVRDDGLLRAVMKYIVVPEIASEGKADITFADMGAGGGHYSTWLNDTGIVQAYAFDGIPNIGEITGGRVSFLNLAQSSDTLPLWISALAPFDWVISLEVGEHLPQEHSAALIRHWDQFCKKGLIMSWSEDTQGIGHVNPLSFDKVLSLMAEHAPTLRWDRESTLLMRQNAQIEYVSRTVAVFRRIVTK